MINAQPPATPVLNFHVLVNINSNLADSQIGSAIQPNQTVYYEKQNHHLIRKIEAAAPLSAYAYHATLSSNISRVNHFTVAPEAYDYIDQHIDLSVLATPVIQVRNQRDNDRK